MNAIQKSDLQVAKQELTNELSLNSNVSEDEKIQKLEQIFCCDPFDKEFVKKLVDVYQKRKELDPSQANLDSYHNLIEYYSDYLPSQNNFFLTIFPDLLGLIDRKLQIFHSILVKANNNYGLKKGFIELFRKSYNKLIGIFEGIKVLVTTHSKKVIFLIVIAVTIVIILLLAIDESNKLNTQAETALEQFKTQEIEGLESALDAANQLNQLVSKKISYSPFLKSLLPLSPINSLQTIVNHIHEKNRSETFINQNSIKTISSDGKSVALSTGNDSVEIWDLFLLKRELVLKSCHKNISSISFDPTNENILATGGIDGKVCFLNRKTRQSTSLFLEGKESPIKSVNFSPKAKFLAMSEMNGNVELIDPKYRKVILSSWQPSNDVDEKVTFDVSFNNDENKIATVSKDGIIKIWNYPSSPILKAQSGTSPKKIKSWKVDDFSGGNNPFFKTSFTKDGELIIMTEIDIAVFSRMRGNRILERLTAQDCNTPHSCDYRYNTLNYLKYSKKDLVNQEQSNVIPIETLSLNGYRASDENKDVTVSSASFYDTQTKLITVNSKNLIQFWDLSKKEDLHLSWNQSTDHPIMKLSVRNSTEEKNFITSLLTLDSNNKLEAWSKDGKPVPKREIIAKNVSFIPQRDDFVTINKNGDIEFWNVNKFELLSDSLERVIN